MTDPRFSGLMAHMDGYDTERGCKIAEITNTQFGRMIRMGLRMEVQCCPDDFYWANSAA